MKNTNDTTRPLPPAGGAESHFLREIREELRRVCEALGELQARIVSAAPV
jgi:hypothetical protein